MSRSETKAQLRQKIEELKRQLTDSQHRLQESESAQEDLEEARRDKQQLEEELHDAHQRLEEASAALEEALAELSTARSAGGRDPRGSEVEELTQEMEDLRSRYEEAEDLTHQKQWELDQLQSQCELDTLRAKESLREELKAAHAQELKVRDDLIEMLRARLADSEASPKPKGTQAGVKKVTFAPSVPSPKAGAEEAPAAKQEDKEEGAAKVTRKVTLPSIPRFSGEKVEDGAFERWTKKLLRHAELEKWTEREKLLQLELHLTNRAEQLYEVLPAESKTEFSKAVEALGKRLQPVKSEALLSAQLLKRKRRARLSSRRRWKL